MVVNQFSLKPLVELLSSASSVDSPVLVDSLVSGLAALLFSTQKLVFNSLSWGGKNGNKEEGRTLTLLSSLLSVMVRVAMYPSSNVPLHCWVTPFPLVFEVLQSIILPL